MSLRTLDPCTLPLKAGGLIEASAGTGKTYTLVAIYLRLLLETGLDLDRILVVTFTNAATEELRGRIRLRLREAVEALATNACADPGLAPLLARIENREAARRHLDDTLTRLDEAAVYTIHGFCQRMLQDNAFESGAAFEAELVTDETLLRRTVAADFWRRRTATLDLLDARWLRETWKNPEDLFSTVGPLLRDGRSGLLPDPQALPETGDLAALARDFEALKTAWTADGAAVARILETDPGLNRRSYTKAVVRNALAAMDALVAGEMPFTLPKGFERFTPALLAQQTKAGQAVPDHRFFHRCGTFSSELETTLRAKRIRLIAEARTAIAAELAQSKHRRQVLFFDDLLRLLDQALAGDGGPALAAAIRRRFPVALIDEFQDTDPIQYRIFRRIYPQDEDGVLFLIGDPKQAIYSFRGADIFTYMQARDDAGPERIHTLGTNWRSAAGLVKAVNTLFSQARRPFVYDRHIPFMPVAPGPEADRKPLILDGKSPPPLQIVFIPSAGLATTGKEARINADAARQSAARNCAEKIVHLLALGGQGRARIGDDPVKAADIAVLVRSHRDGMRIQEALRARGVASVSLSRESVFDTPEAESLERVLLALAGPGHEGRLRAALATGLMGWQAGRILGLDLDERDHDRLQVRFRGYRDLWLRRGFEAAFFALLDGEKVCRRLRAEADGERRLTNLLHLGELLQAASRGCAGIEGLLRWLADQRAGLTGSEDERLLRLESDEALVRIVTIHKSKGLEYPVVFIPFAWAGAAPQSGPAAFHGPAPEYRPFLDFGSDEMEGHQTLAATEDLAERLRLFYVAVTRARNLCVLTWGRINNAESSAPAWLIHPDEAADPPQSVMRRLSEDEIRRRLEDLAASAGGTILIETAEAAADRVAAPPAPAGPAPAAREFTGRIVRDWRLTSYSGLAAGADVERPDYDPQPAAEPAAAPLEPVDPVFRFPRGTGPGQCLHELLEMIDFTSAGGPDLDRAVADQLARYAIDPAWGPVVAGMVGRVLDTRLDGGDLCLRSIGPGDRRDEMAFHYPLAGLDPRKLGGVLGWFPAYRSAGAGLSFDPVRGLMKGFIDLVFRHQGRFYIVDYKSNHLGDRFADYARERLGAVMAAHRYDLQYLVYTVALHRYLKLRLAGYDYRRHFGGVYYLFLRGLHPDRGAGCGLFYDLPDPGLVQALDDFLAGRDVTFTKSGAL